MQIETERLVLRRPVITDAQNIFRSYAGELAVTRYLSWPRHRSVADSYAFVEWSDAEWRLWPAGPLVALARGGGKRVLGAAGLHYDAAGHASAGYLLARSAWGQGLATEMLEAMVVWAGRLGLQEVQAQCHPANLASEKVLSKCGFERRSGGGQKIYFPNLDGGRMDMADSWLRKL